jgi:hypothetical protein
MVSAWPARRVGSLGEGRRFRVVLLSVLALGAALAPVARAGDRVYWGNFGVNPGKISYASLDGTGGADLNTAGAPTNGPEGLTIDTATGRIFWGDYSPATSEVAFAKLDDTGGGGTLSTSGATPAENWGLAIDPAAGRIYWSQSDGAGAVSYANLNGSGGGDLSTAGASADGRGGVAIDPASNRIYFTEYTKNKISYANLDGTGGGGDLNTGAAAVNEPLGVALDLTNGKIYWTNRNGNSIAWASLNGSSAGTLTITGAIVSRPVGIAIDPVAGKIYWANGGADSGGVDNISFANLDGSGGGTVVTAPATVATPQFPVLLRSPSGTGAPGVTGGSTTGSPLLCSEGSWAPDLLGSFLYRGPTSFSFQWSLNGADIAGATSSSYTASSPGSYTCRVTASNEAGASSPQTSAVHVVSTAPASQPPSLSGASQSHRRWREGSGLPHIARAKRPPVGTSFRFRIDQSVRVRFTFTQRLPGRRVGGRCVKPTATNLSKPRCTRLVTRGALSFSVGAGQHTVRFQGRLSKHKRLPIGRYRLRITATNAAGQRATANLTFTIVRG